MALLIDPPLWPAHGTLWSHLVSDESYEELHACAAGLGLPRRGFDLDHYDVPASLYEAALALGVLPTDSRDLVRRLRGAGLRVPQRDRAAAVPIQRRNYLRDEWRGLGERLTCASEAWSALGEWLLACWNEPHRRYHDERHLNDVLLALNHLRVRGEDVAESTLLAAWFHDAVYLSEPSDESASAELAEAELLAVGLQPAVADRVAGFIRDTSPSAHVADPEPALTQLLDADLWIFAAPADRYGDYRAAVRQEYAHVPDPEFASGRAAILERYVSRPTIYFGPVARELWEQRARDNLAAELEHLSRVKDHTATS